MIRIKITFIFWMTLIGSIPTWAQTASIGSLQHISNFPSIYLVSRNVDVWLPDNYDNTKTYPVIYMQDGQNLFDAQVARFNKEWKVDETLDELIKNKSVEPVIVVGIWSTPNRFREYFPEDVWLGFDPFIQTFLEGEGKGEPLGNKYLKFLTSELKPYIDSHFPTKKDRKNTFIAGSSMGALISLYAICSYPDVFGGAACLSTNWPGSIKFEGKEIPLGFIQYFSKHMPLPVTHNIYFDLGNNTLDSLYPPYQKLMDSVMRECGFNKQNWATRFFPGASHSEVSWAERFHEPALFLLNQRRYNKLH